MGFWAPAVVGEHQASKQLSVDVSQWILQWVSEQFLNSTSAQYRQYRQPAVDTALPQYSTYLTEMCPQACLSAGVIQSHRISPDRIDISNVWKNPDQLQPLPRWRKEIRWTLVHKRKSFWAHIDPPQERFQCNLMQVHSQCDFKIWFLESFASGHCCERNVDYLHVNWFFTRTCFVGRPHVGLCFILLVNINNIQINYTNNLT